MSGGIYYPIFTVTDNAGNWQQRKIAVRVGIDSQPNITVISPRDGENWQLGQNHTIRLNRPLNVNFPVNSQVMIKLVHKDGECPLSGIVDCLKQISGQAEFIWDGRTLVNFCGAAGPTSKYKGIYPGYYRLRFVEDNPTQTILAESGLFWLTGEPSFPDYNKPIGG